MKKLEKKNKILYEEPRINISLFYETDVSATSGQGSAWDDGNIDSNGWT